VAKNIDFGLVEAKLIKQVDARRGPHSCDSPPATEVICAEPAPAWGSLSGVLGETDAAR